MREEFTEENAPGLISFMLENTVCSWKSWLREIGNGEWIVGIMEEAKQMAKDFASGKEA